MEKVSIPVTDQDREDMIQLCFVWIKEKKTNEIKYTYANSAFNGYNCKYYLYLNNIANCWEEWSKELEDQIKEEFNKQM